MEHVFACFLARNLAVRREEYGADPLYQFAGVGLLHVVAAHCTDFTSECLQNLLKEGLQVRQGGLLCRTPGVTRGRRHLCVRPGRRHVGRDEESR